MYICLMERRVVPGCKKIEGKRHGGANTCVRLKGPGGRGGCVCVCVCVQRWRDCAYVANIEDLMRPV